MLFVNMYSLNGLALECLAFIREEPIYFHFFFNSFFIRVLLKVFLFQFLFEIHLSIRDLSLWPLLVYTTPT